MTDTTTMDLWIQQENLNKQTNNSEPTLAHIQLSIKITRAHLDERLMKQTNRTGMKIVVLGVSNYKT